MRNKRIQDSKGNSDKMYSDKMAIINGVIRMKAEVVESVYYLGNDK